MSLAMTRQQRERFLADLHVAVLSIADPDGGSPVAAPVWYSYEPGGSVRLFTGKGSLKTRALRAAGRATITAQTEDLPYKYVSVEGSVEIDEAIDRAAREAMAVRYLGEELGAAYLASTPAEGSVTVVLSTDRWRTADFGKEVG